ncbi:hypothetical protein C1I08_15080 [Listeria monocytogenes]|nr:hypothetical protein BB730_02345 [Listeria monocytogenes]PMQ84324.1 hypothetical protein C1I08_15080 [Listeria monocytogenes]
MNYFHSIPVRTFFAQKDPAEARLKIHLALIVLITNVPNPTTIATATHKIFIHLSYKAKYTIKQKFNF